jgi:hypothetical protein
VTSYLTDYWWYLRNDINQKKFTRTYGSVDALLALSVTQSAAKGQLD